MPRKTGRPDSTPRRAPRRSSPQRKGAVGPRPVRRLGSHVAPAPGDAAFEEKYPNLSARREMDRQEHIRAARRMGATRKQAARHADEEVGRTVDP